jgi:hypothetical protein
MSNKVTSRLEKLTNGLLAATVAGLVAAVLFLAAVPPVDRDGLTHHLAVPKLYLKHGRMLEIPTVSFSYYPMNLEMLYLVPLFFGNDIAPKYIHFGFAVLTAGLIGAYLRRRLKPVGHVGLGILLFLSLPVIIKLSVTVYVDLGLIFFATACWYALFHWAASGFRLKHLVMAGIFAGLCLGTKPNGLLAVLFLALVVPFLHRRAAALSGLSPVALPGRLFAGFGDLRFIRWVLVFVLVAGVVFSPWMVRNWLWTGNPFYPFAQSLFRSADRHAAPPADPGLDGEAQVETGAQRSGGLGHFAVRKLVFGENLLEIMAIPLRVFFQGRDDDPRLFDGRLNPCLLIFPILALAPLARKPRSAIFQLELRTLALFSAFYLVFAFFLTDMRIRYLGPIIPPLVILATVGIRDLAAYGEQRAGQRHRALALGMVMTVVAFFLGLNGLYLYGQFKVIDPWPYLNGTVSRDQYILKHRPEYAAISWGNRYLPEEARILALFNGNRIYYSDREMISDAGLFANLAVSGVSAEGFRRELSRRGISHILVRVDLFKQRLKSLLDENSNGVLREFIENHVQELHQENGYVILKLGRS